MKKGILIVLIGLLLIGCGKLSTNSSDISDEIQQSVGSTGITTANSNVRLHTYVTPNFGIVMVSPNRTYFSAGEKVLLNTISTANYTFNYYEINNNKSYIVTKNPYLLTIAPSVNSVTVYSILN